MIRQRAQSRRKRVRLPHILVITLGRDNTGNDISSAMTLDRIDRLSPAK